MAVGLAEFRCQICFDKLPCDFRTDRAATHAQHVHVVVFHALVRRKMIANQAGTNSGNLVSRDGGADTTAAHRNAALYLAGRNSASERNDEIGIIVAWDEVMRPEVDHFMPSRLET